MGRCWLDGDQYTEGWTAGRHETLVKHVFEGAGHGLDVAEIFYFHEECSLSVLKDAVQG